jgi:hypothetical protein
MEKKIQKAIGGPGKLGLEFLGLGIVQYNYAEFKFFEEDETSMEKPNRFYDESHDLISEHRAQLCYYFSDDVYDGILAKLKQNNIEFLEEEDTGTACMIIKVQAFPILFIKHGWNNKRFYDKLFYSSSNRLPNPFVERN